MRRIKLLILLLLAAISLYAQNSGDVEHSSLNTWGIGAGGVSVYDPQLSSSVYRGFSVTVEGVHQNHYVKNDKAWWVVSDRLSYGRVLNESHTAAMQHLRGKFSYASGYMYRHDESGWKIRCMAGGSLRLSGILNYLPRNYNNVASADVRLLACGFFQFGFMTVPAGSAVKELGIHYSVEFPLIGCSFAPDYGESYYEVWASEPGIGSLARFASLHNCWEADGKLTLSLGFKKFIMSMSFVHDNSLLVPTWNVPEYRFWHNDLSGELSFTLYLGRMNVQ